MVKRMLIAVVVTSLVAGGAAAMGWDTPSLTAELRGNATSNLFPGSGSGTPDHGLEGAFTAEAARRLSRNLKLGVAAAISGQAWIRSSEASFAEFSAASWLRRGGTTLRIDGTLTPSRLKFPATLDGGRFSRLELRAGVRQALTPRLRLRLEGRAQVDDFVSTYDARDGDTGEGYAQLALRASDAATLRADVLLGRTRTASSKYAHGDHTVGGALALARGPWSAELAVTSGLSRYDRAQPADGNYLRRDQSLEARVELDRALGTALTASIAGSFFDQTSSRPDRTYDLHRLQLGLVWHPAAP